MLFFSLLNSLYFVFLESASSSVLIFRPGTSTSPSIPLKSRPEVNEYSPLVKIPSWCCYNHSQHRRSPLQWGAEEKFVSSPELWVDNVVPVGYQPIGGNSSVGRKGFPTWPVSPEHVPDLRHSRGRRFVFCSGYLFTAFVYGQLLHSQIYP